MNVSAILQSKGSNVVIARPDVTLGEVVRMLREAHIGAVVISSDRVRVEGILSERDIVTGLAEHGAAALAMRASALMTHAVTICGPDDHVADLMAVMTEKRIRHLPVMDEGSLVGIVSIGDVVKWRVEEIEHEAEALRTYVTQG